MPERARDRRGRYTRDSLRPYASLVGKKFGRLRVLRFAGIEPRADGLARFWQVKCRCGQIRYRSTNALQSGRVRSCGNNCRILVKQSIAQGWSNRKHGHCRVRNGVRQNSPTWISWRSMHMRCNDPKRKGYGAKGIKVCKRWSGKSGFIHFLRDMKKRPHGRTLDRKNPNTNYTPRNCRWATASQQNRNKAESLRDIALRAWVTKRAKAQA